MGREIRYGNRAPLEPSKVYSASYQTCASSSSSSSSVSSFIRTVHTRMSAGGRWRPAGESRENCTQKKQNRVLYNYTHTRIGNSLCVHTSRSYKKRTKVKWPARCLSLSLTYDLTGVNPLQATETHSNREHLRIDSYRHKINTFQQRLDTAALRANVMVETVRKCCCC